MLIHAENQTPGSFGDDIKECKSRLLSKLEEEYRGAMIRCRMQTLERDEEPTKVFKTKERERATKNKITVLRVGEVLLTRQEDIERELVKFYEELFKGKQNSNDHLSKKFLKMMPQVEKSVWELVNQDITVEEVIEAIKELAPRKSPGVDGLGAAFYKTCSEQIAPILCEVYADILKRQLLPPSMRQSVIVLIPKKISSDNIRSADDYRPISLLTVDYKILAKILSKRLESALQKEE